MKILITGVHGFVGSNLVKALSKEHVIYGLDIIAPKKEGVRFTFSWDYLNQPGEIPDVDAIIHLAGKAHDTKNQSAAEVYFKVNTELTEKIYDYFLQSKAKKFIFFSSVKAAADRVEGDYVDESVVPAPVGPYGESKIKAEDYIRGKEAERIANGKETYILRPCMIHGPGNKGNLNLLYGVVKRGIPWPLGAFENKRTFTSIDNLCFIIKGLLAEHVESGVYNINDDEAVSTNELIGIICSALGKRARIWRIPRRLMEGCAQVGGVLHLPLNPERLQKLTENYVSSNAKIKKALGVDRLPVRAKDGLTVTIKSFD
ncbi:MAG: NAD-dependent epimerase/dehydratase family protein [Prevotella sp.]|nr:NAD-dependent epimerase/dehydratase family protein [Prevotella sp.]